LYSSSKVSSRLPLASEVRSQGPSPLQARPGLLLWRRACGGFGSPGDGSGNRAAGGVHAAETVTGPPYFLPCRDTGNGTSAASALRDECRTHGRRTAEQVVWGQP
jgi:hypothetical protein